MKLDKALFTNLLTKLTAFAKKYGVFIFVIITLGLFGYLVYTIRVLAAKEPSESAVIEKMGTERPINIDESAVKTIQELQSTNVEVKALFDQNRDNPFQE